MNVAQQVKVGVTLSARLPVFPRFRVGATGRLIFVFAGRTVPPLTTDAFRSDLE